MISFKTIVLIIISSILIGCNSSSSNDTTPIFNTGTFIDSPVEGIKYVTDSTSGYTNHKGEYQYQIGEIIRLYLGNLELGSVVGRSIITPLTLSGESDLNNIGTKATNIARLLQTLDNNSSNNEKLLIPISLKDLDISNLDLESEADINTIIAKAQNKTQVSYILKDATSAKNTMKKYLEDNNIILSTDGSVDTVNLGACVGCHGTNFEKNALGKSQVVKDMTKEEVSSALLGYKNGTYGNAMKGVMQGQVRKYTDDALRNTNLGI